MSDETERTFMICGTVLISICLICTVVAGIYDVKNKQTNTTPTVTSRSENK